MNRFYLKIVLVCLALWAMAGGLTACKRSLNSDLPTATQIAAPNTTATAIPQTSNSTAQPASTSALSTPLVTLTPAGGQATAQLPPPAHKLAVFNLAKGEVLNIREKASTSAKIIETLNADARDIIPTGQVVNADEINWVEIKIPGQDNSGWVSSAFVAEQVSADAFCADARVGQLIDQFTLAIRKQDGEALARLVSPAHGLLLYRSPGSGTVVTITDPHEIAGLFASSAAYAWGADSASGQPVSGSFMEKFYPALINVIGVSSQRVCNSLENGVASGASSAPAVWPFDYRALNFIALYRAAPADQEHDWRTWAVGVDYVNGTPFINVLLQYYWTP